MKVLIIGKNSYLGQHIGKALTNTGHEVLYLTHKKLQDLPEDTISFYDFIENKVSAEKFNNIELVLNCAVCYGKQDESCCDMLEANVVYPLRILEWAASYNVKYFINTSTSITTLVNSYTLSKNHFSEWGKFFAENNSIQFINVILEHFFGPNCSENNFISMLLHKMSANKRFLDLTNGMQLRDFIYIDDVVSAYICIIKHLSEICEQYYEISVGSGVPYRIKEICEWVKVLLKSKTELRFGVLPYRKHEIMYSCADNFQLRRWGWERKISFDEGIRMIIEKENL